jgi:hypothetical protein
MEVGGGDGVEETQAGDYEGLDDAAAGGIVSLSFSSMCLVVFCGREGGIVCGLIDVCGELTNSTCYLLRQ